MTLDEDSLRGILGGALGGAGLGSIAAFGTAFDPRIARAIPSDKLRIFGPIIGGAALGGTLGGMLDKESSYQRGKLMTPYQQGYLSGLRKLAVYVPLQNPCEYDKRGWE